MLDWSATDEIRSGDIVSLTSVSIALVVGAVICYLAFVLYGAKIDGDRQDVRKEGLHPVTDPNGMVHGEVRSTERIREQENGNGSSKRR